VAGTADPRGDHTLVIAIDVDAIHEFVQERCSHLGDHEAVVAPHDAVAEGAIAEEAPVEDGLHPHDRVGARTRVPVLQSEVKRTP
jgi:hypothetical protein